MNQMQASFKRIRGLALWRRFVRLARDRSGVSAVVVAFTLTAMLGFAGLATEIGNWYVTKRTMQGSADSAAYSAALAKLGGASRTIYTSEAKSVTAKYGFTDGSNNVTVTVNNPPASGPNSANNAAVEVIVSQPQPFVLAGLFLGGEATVAARAVAVTGSNGNGCVLALDRANVTDVFDNGNTTVNLNNCSLYVDSPSTGAVNLVGQAVINAYSAYISGGVTTSGGGALNTTNGTNTGVAPANDPYSSIVMPTTAGSGANLGTMSSGTYSPGVYSSINTEGGDISLSPGVYVIQGGGMKLGAHATLSGTGVTIVLAGSGGNYGSIDVRSGSSINLTPPSTGTTAGIAIFQDRNASSVSDSWAGGPSTQVTGVIYTPNTATTYTGGTDTGGAMCTQLVALTISFRGNASFNNNCAGVNGVKNIGSSATALVE